MAAQANYAPSCWIRSQGSATTNSASTAWRPQQQPIPHADSVDFARPSLNSGLTAAQLAAISASLGLDQRHFGPLPMVETDSTFQQDPQTFLYPFTVAFSNQEHLQPAGRRIETVTLTVNASFTVGPVTGTNSATTLLTSGENPRFENIDLSHPGDFPVMAQFRPPIPQNDGAVVGSRSTASRFGATDDAAIAPMRRRSSLEVISNLTAGQRHRWRGDTFDPGLSQDEEASSLEFLPQDNAGNFVFNFAVARVRLLGNTPGAQAKKVRVFFRLFQAQTTASNFNPDTTYRYHSDGVLNGVTVPLLGIQNDQNGNPEYVTVPCFATPRGQHQWTGRHENATGGHA